MIQDKWKPIEGCPYYYCSHLGKVKSDKRPAYLNSIDATVVRRRKIFKPNNTNGYSRVKLDGKFYFVHKLVAQAFVPNPEKKPQVNHKNGNKLDNRAENLEWCNNSENQNHAISIGLKKSRKGQPKNKLTHEIVDVIRKTYKRGDAIALSKSLNVSKQTIHNVITNKSWVI